jgi:hypothetical protein
MDWLSLADFLIGITGLIIGLSPTGFGFLKDHVRREKFRRLFGAPNSACIVIPTHADYTIGKVPRIHRMLKVETAMAAIRLRDHLQQLGWKVEIMRSTDSGIVLDRCRKSTMFFLGSTRATRVAVELFGELESAFSFEEHDGRPFIGEKSKTGKTISEFFSPMDEGGDADQGLVIKASNRYCPGHKVFWLAGIHAIGTWGATEFLCANEGLHEILSHVGSEDFAAVIQTKFSGLLKVTGFVVELTPRIFPG